MTDKQKPFNPADIAQAFKFEPGDHIYLVEVKTDAGITKDDLYKLGQAFNNADIHVRFIATNGTGFKVNTVPAKEQTE